MGEHGKMENGQTDQRHCCYGTIDKNLQKVGRYSGGGLQQPGMAHDMISYMKL